MGSRRNIQEAEQWYQWAVCFSEGYNSGMEVTNTRDLQDRDKLNKKE